MEISWMAKLIVEQQDIGAETLAQLHALGVVDDVTLLRMDFHYLAPGKSQAESLVAFLRQRTDYDLQVSRELLRGFRRGWLVAGKTQLTTISMEILNQWIRWMVHAGSLHGECRFDGWGALVPE